MSRFQEWIVEFFNETSEDNYTPFDRDGNGVYDVLEGDNDGNGYVDSYEYAYDDSDYYYGGGWEE